MKLSEEKIPGFRKFLFVFYRQHHQGWSQALPGDGIKSIPRC